MRSRNDYSAFSSHYRMGHRDLTSFGGWLARLHRWISEERFLNALNFCMRLPCAESQQLSVYLGWLLHKKTGGLIAGLLFILPGFFCILQFRLIYETFGNTFFKRGLFLIPDLYQIDKKLMRDIAALIDQRAIAASLLSCV